MVRELVIAKLSLERQQRASYRVKSIQDLVNEQRDGKKEIVWD